MLIGDVTPHLKTCYIWGSENITVVLVSNRRPSAGLSLWVHIGFHLLLGTFMWYEYDYPSNLCEVSLPTAVRLLCTDKMCYPTTAVILLQVIANTIWSRIDHSSTTYIGLWVGGAGSEVLSQGQVRHAAAAPYHQLPSIFKNAAGMTAVTVWNDIMPNNAHRRCNTTFKNMLHLRQWKYYSCSCF